MLPAEPHQVRVARRFARRLTADWGIDEECLADLLLIVGELTADSALHGGTEMSVRIWLAGPELCVEVTDTGAPSHLSGSAVTDDGERARRLELVARLSDWCSVDRAPLRRRVRAGFGVVRCSEG